jgi:hypothetical protein
MKVGDLLYYRPPYDDGLSVDCIGIIIAEKHEDGELKMRTLWFDDWMCTSEPIPGSVFYDEAHVGVISESR